MGSDNPSQNLSEQEALKSNRGFKLLGFSSMFSLLADQLTLLTLPWLVLSLSSDPLVLGSVIGTLAIPMSVLILLGGVLVDKFSPKIILIITKFSSALIMCGISALMFYQLLTIPILYASVFLLGTCTAFAAPAATAILPTILRQADLQPANGILMSIRSFAMLIGPLLAAYVLGVGSSESAGGEVPSQTLALAFFINGLSFIVSLLLMAGVLVPAMKPKRDSSVINDLFSAFSFFWQQKELKLVVVYAALTGIFVSGPTQVALPLLVRDQLNAGPSSFSIIMAAGALGAMIGMAISAKIPKVGKLTLGMTLILVDFIAGVFLIGFSFLKSILLAVMLMLIIQIFTGYVQVALMTWIQRQSSPEMLGRMMSIVLFSIIGLMPLSASAAGYLLVFCSADTLYRMAGVLLSCIALLGLMFTGIREIKAAPVPV